MQCEEYWEYAESKQAPVQTRGHKRNMALRRKRILARGRMHKRIEEFANRRR